MVKSNSSSDDFFEDESSIPRSSGPPDLEAEKPPGLEAEKPPDELEPFKTLLDYVRGKEVIEEQQKGNSTGKEIVKRSNNILPKNLFEPDERFYTAQQVVNYLLGPQNPNKLLIVGDFTGAKLFFVWIFGYYYRLSLDWIRGYVKQFFYGGNHRKNEIETVIYEISTELPKIPQDYLDSDEDIVNFANGLYHLSTGEVTPHSPDVYSTVQIPICYRSGLTMNNAPNFDSFLDMLTNGDTEAKSFILEFIGVALSNIPGYRFKTSLILYGPGNTGKTQLRELIQYLVGHRNCQTIDLDKLERRFGTSQLFGKRFAGSGDLPSAKIKELSTFKALTGGDYVNAEFKGKDSFSFRYNGVFMFCCNQLPSFSGDRGSHVYDRFSIIECPNVIPPEQQDKNILQKMLDEAEAIICVALKHCQEAVKRGYRFTESIRMKQMRRAYEEQNDSVVQFITECCTIDSKARTKRSEFFEAYYYWCRTEQIPSCKKADIQKTLMDKFGIVPKKSGEIYLPLTINWPKSSLPRFNY